MLDSLHHLVYGWEKASDQLNSLKILSYMYLIAKERPIRLNKQPLDTERLLENLLERLRSSKCSPVLMNVVKSVIDFLNKKDEMMCYFVLVATFHLENEILLSTLREKSVSIDFVREDWFSRGNHDDHLQPSLYSSPIERDGVLQLPWDISSALQEGLARTIDLDPASSNDLEYPLDEFGQPTAASWSLLKDNALKLYCKNNPDFIKNLTSGSDDDALDFDYHCFDQATAKKFVAHLYNDVGSYIFQPYLDDETIMFEVCVSCEVDGLGDNMGTISVMQKHLLLYQKWHEQVQRLSSYNPRDNMCYKLVKECCVQQLDSMKNDISFKLKSPSHIRLVLRSLAQYVGEVITFLTTLCNILECNMMATEMYSELKNVYHSTPCSTSAFVLTVLRHVGELITSRIESYMVNGCWSFTDGVFTDVIPANAKDWPPTLPVFLQANDDLSSNLCILIVQHGCVMNFVQGTDYEKYRVVENKEYARTELSTFEVLHLGLVISKLYRKVQNLDLIRDLLADLTYSVKIIGAIYLKIGLSFNNTGCHTQKASLSSAWKTLKKEGFPLRHVFAVDHFESRYLSYKPPPPLSFFISGRQVTYYSEVQILVESLVSADAALEEINISGHLPFVLGEERRALIRRHFIVRFIKGLKEFVLSEIRETWMLLQKQLAVSSSVAQLITAFRVFVRSLRHVTFLKQNTRSSRQLIQAICSSCLEFCEAFNMGDDRSVELYHKKFADNAQILCQKLSSDRTLQSRNILWRIDYFNEILDTNTIDESAMNISSLSRERYNVI